MEIRIQPLGIDGDIRPMKTIKPPKFCDLIAFRCPTFDAGHGDTIRIGFNTARHVRFAFRPKIAAAKPAK